MAKQIARLLKTDIMADMDLKALAQILQKQGRGNDTVLAHITKKEAERLKKQGGSGTINPNTGLPEFDDTGALDSYSSGMESGGGYDPTTQQMAQAPADVSQTSAPVNATPQTTPTNQPQVFSSSGAGTTPTFDFGVPSVSQAAGTSVAPQVSASSAGAAPSLPMAYDPNSTVGQMGALGTTQPGTQQDNTLLNKLLSSENIGKYGLAGIQGLIGAYQTNKAQKQGQQAKAEQIAMAQPYQTQGKQLVDQAQRGELSTASQQQLEAAQAQAAQGVEARGGVGAAQYQAQIEGLRQQLLNQQYQLGLQISNIGDSIATGAIKTGMQADQYVNQLTSNYFTNIARTAMGSAPQVAQSTIPSNYGVSA